jgi:hypothetical protein
MYRTTVQFPYLETCGVRKWEETKREGGAWQEDSSCFVVGDISEQIRVPNTSAARTLAAGTVTVMCF